MVTGAYQWSFRKTGTVGTLASQAELVTKHRGRTCHSQSLAVLQVGSRRGRPLSLHGLRSVGPEKF